MPNKAHDHEVLGAQYQAWLGRFANQSMCYFGHHDKGRPIQYRFNSQGYRGPEHHPTPDLAIFGSSFSFGVGIEWHQCWHQQLGDYRVNCYAVAGFLAVNHDIIRHCLATNHNAGRVILQLRESRYDRSHIPIPQDIFCFAVDEHEQQGMLTFTWAEWKDDLAEDGKHPGANTHKQWANKIRTVLDL